METEPASEALTFFKKIDNGQVPNKKSVSVNFSLLCSLFGFLDPWRWDRWVVLQCP